MMCDLQFANCKSKASNAANPYHHRMRFPCRAAARRRGDLSQACDGKEPGGGEEGAGFSGEVAESGWVLDGDAGWECVSDYDGVAGGDGVSGEREHTDARAVCGPGAEGGAIFDGERDAVGIDHGAGGRRGAADVWAWVC